MAYKIEKHTNSTPERKLSFLNEVLLKNVNRCIKNVIDPDLVWSQLLEIFPYSPNSTMIRLRRLKNN